MLLGISIKQRYPEMQVIGGNVAPAVRYARVWSADSADWDQEVTAAISLLFFISCASFFCSSSVSIYKKKQVLHINNNNHSELPGQSWPPCELASALPQSSLALVALERKQNKKEKINNSIEQSPSYFLLFFVDVR